MINIITYNVLVLDPDIKFLETLKYAMSEVVEKSDSNINMIVINQESQLVSLNVDTIWSRVLIDTSFVSKEIINYFNNLLKKNPYCEIVLLVSSQDGLKIKETIRMIDSLDVIEGIEFILGDNVSDIMKVTQCLTFIKNGLK